MKATDHYGTTVLEDACNGCDCHPWIKKDRDRIAQILLDNGADVEYSITEKLRTRGKEMLATILFPLHEACAMNDEEIVERLLDTTKTLSQNLNSRDFAGDTPVYKACKLHGQHSYRDEINQGWRS